MHDRRTLAFFVRSWIRPYTEGVMLGRYLRILALLLLAAFVLDVGDADCAVDPRSSHGAQACSGDERTDGEREAGGCACCIAAETASPVTPLRVPEAPAQRLALASARLCAGVHPVPYRPPLSLS